MIRASVVLIAVASLVSPVQAQPAPNQPGNLEDRRELMRQITQELQARLEQRLRCINQAQSFNDLMGCQANNRNGWHHGPGMGGWECPMW